MKKLMKLFGLLAVLATLSFGAAARDTVPIIDHHDILIPNAAGKSISPDKVRDAIIAGGAAKGWEVTKTSNPDVLVATLNVRGKHSMTVSIKYSAEKFSVVYLNSTNMNYHLADAPPQGSTDLTKINSPAAQAGSPLIHPNYNRWVQGLLQSVQSELRRL